MALGGLKTSITWGLTGRSVSTLLTHPKPPTAGGNTHLNHPGTLKAPSIFTLSPDEASRFVPFVSVD
jgi:hypothetical protein